METIEMNVQFKLTVAKLWGTSVFCALFKLLVSVHVLYYFDPETPWFLFQSHCFLYNK